MEQRQSFWPIDETLRPEIIEGIVREGQLGALGGVYGVGKSPLLADLAVHLVRGLAWCGRPVNGPRPVIGIDLETPGATYRRNLKSAAERLGVELPQVPEELEVYLEHDAPASPATARLLSVIKDKKPESRFDLLREALERKPNAAVFIDPVELFIRIDTRRKDNVLWLYEKLRLLLAEFPQAFILNTFNLRKPDRKLGWPSLLTNPRQWLDEVAGTSDIMNRSDLRVGLDMYQGNEDVRILNGIRRGEEMHPLLIRRVPIDGTADEWAGFELCPPQAIDLEAVLSREQLAYWRKLPFDFRFEEVAEKIVPRSSLSRLLRRAEQFGAIRHEDGAWRKAQAGGSVELEPKNAENVFAISK